MFKNEVTDIALKKGQLDTMTYAREYRQTCTFFKDSAQYRAYIYQ